MVVMADLPLRPPLTVAAYTAKIRAEATHLAASALQAGPDADVRTCPGWDVHELVQHTGRVHRWATTIVADRRDAPPGGSRHIEVPAGRQSADELARWFADGAAVLATAIDTADPELACWTFLPSSSPREFWARRQAHETAMHRVDAEIAAGGAPTPFDAEFAADGADERLAFIVRDATQRAAHPQTLRVTTTDAVGDWDLVVDAAGVAIAAGGTTPADATASGAASDVYLAFWGRPPGAPLETAGDPAVLAMFLAAAGA